jgi:pyruvate,water dikinase
LQDTYLWVRGLEGVTHCVKSCWASLYSVESVTHRLQSRVVEQSVALGVVIQRMVNAHCSGVMLTRNPTADDRTVVTIEGSWGLGSSIASGEVLPDQFIVSKVTGELLSRTLADKATQHLPDTIAGGVRREPVPDELRSVQCLTDSQIAELAQVAKRVERHYGCAQVIDWAIAQGERGVYLLQTRSEQAWPQRESARNTQRKAETSDPVVSLLSGRRR